MPEKQQPFWKSQGAKKAWRILRPVTVGLIALSVTYFVFSFALNFILDRYIRPVDINDDTPIELIVNDSDSASLVASKLVNAGGESSKGLISNPTVFKIYVDFVGKANKLQPGTYILSRNMTVPQIVDILSDGKAAQARTILKFRVQEGYTINGVIFSLGEVGATVDEAAFLELCNDAEAFGKYEFITKVAELNDGSKRDYLVEGYLFPDTYEIYSDAQPATIINKMLVRFNEIFTDEYMDRANDLGMTVDEVVTLASVIEREAQVDEDFAKVSAVFHNRLKAGQKLESCASLQYVLKSNKYVYSAEERATVSPYNTYLNEGLPVGPICNPGKRAIEAALYPNEAYLEKDYRYFCNMDLPENKALAFARTYEEHQENVSKYSQYWS
ncbi:endolytic transglycosylase MltG [Christensenellaceae bacterium OttesenSCG-928-L17]|nr:endolytic transglycosylase MltG [Christensenellaceae bacterium OttesenSCG-928-L17]